MDIKAITVALVAVMVGAVVLGATYPIFGDLSDDQKTVFNNDYNRYSRLIDSDLENLSLKIEWNDLTQGSVIITVGTNDPYTLSVSRSRVPLIMTPYGTVEENAVNSRGILRSVDSPTYSYLTGGPIVITVASGVVTVTNGSGDDMTTTTFNVGDWLFYPDDKGDYTAMNTTSSADDVIKINSIDDLYFCTTINTDSLGFVSGHGDTCTFYSQPDTPSYSMELLSSQPLDGYTDVITTKITQYAISSEAGTNSDDSQFVPFITMVPRAVTGHTSMDNTMSMMFQLIPLVLTIGVLLGAIGWFISRKF